MNAELEMTYLSGGATTGSAPISAGASIYTNARVGLAATARTSTASSSISASRSRCECVMSAVLLGGEDEEDAAEQWLADHAEEWEGWLDGVKTRDGRDALEVAREELVG